ncbi:alcohol dehydrogenase catalytic domain-containing protein [Mycolicibacterium mageritense]|nr:alcohol dehydrogenase catalytic domain-containing protein [Mycolicibacterium mageritense]MCC9180329.1 alcohol dehydrogenase catalytic domain-containing protein [Mycolicibacterium mageritense]
MRAVVYPEVGVLPKVVDVADPQCPPDGVIVEVAATGVCRSDWHAWRGHDPVELPIIPGHEFAGTIAAVGAGVTRWQVGDRVTAPFVLGCGRCEFCLSGEAQVCPDQLQPGFTLPGSFAQRVAVPALRQISSACPIRSRSSPPPHWDAGSPHRSAPWSPTVACNPVSGSPCTAAVAWACQR